MVVGHVLRGIDRTSMLHSPEWWKYADKGIYLFHMPLFFYLAGLFFEKTMQHLGYQRMIIRYSAVLIPPLVFWSYLQQGMQYFSSASNIDISLIQLIFSPFPPKQQFWFIGALLLMCCITGWLLTLKKAKLYILGFFIALLTGSAFTINDPSLIFPSGWNWYTLRQTFYHFPYFLLGILITHNSINRIKLGPIVSLTVFFLSLCFYMTSLGAEMEGQVYIATSLVCVLALYKFFDSIQDKWHGKIKDWCIFIGQNSMIIYVAHIIFTAGSRTALIKLGIENYYIHLTIGTISGIAGPLLIIPFSIILSKKVSPLIEAILPYKLPAKEKIRAN